MLLPSSLLMRALVAMYRAMPVLASEQALALSMAALMLLNRDSRPTNERLLAALSNVTVPAVVVWSR